ncbi:hypothetical protein [Bosea beijingensis]
MMRSRASLLAETLLLCGGCLALMFWIIPAQTSEGGFGLSPAFLPTMLSAAILLLVLGDGALRLAAPKAPIPRASVRLPGCWRWRGSGRSSWVMPASPQVRR